MEKRNLAVILALALPLATFGIPYAYALTTSSTYVVVASGTIDGATTGVDSIAAFCNTGDYATGGGMLPGTSSPGGTGTYTFDYTWAIPVVSDNPGYSPAQTGQEPNGWEAGVALSASVTLPYEAFVVCQSPITVAGVTVPEFGSLYAAVALAAALYFGLTVLRQRRTPPAVPAGVPAG